MRTTYFPTLTLTGLLLITACSSTPRAAPVTTTATTIEQPSTTAVPLPTTTTTAAPATTTTNAPPPTTPPEVTAAIKQAVLDYEEVRYACMQEPATCDPTTFARGELVATERSFIDRVVGLRGRSVRRADDPPYWVFGEVTVSPDGQTASVEGCYWATTILAGESGAIINDDNVTYRMTLGLIKDDNTWWLSDKFTNSRVPATNNCGPRP
jgi:hypothetical protein